MRLAIEQAATTAGLTSIAAPSELLREFTVPVLESAARFAGEVLSPLNRVGDREPSRLAADQVVTPPGFRTAYRRFREDGWTSLSAPVECGGQGLPQLLGAATTEMWAGANLAFALCPELAVGAIEALRIHGTAELKERYLPRLASGDWAATMCLTEPQAGSDLSDLRTRAEPDGASWRLSGRKIYISWGDHDLTDNILHFVLARARDAPRGVRGISLFLVPKRLPAADGGLSDNEVRAISLEHKMGIRASPTCVMALGEEHGARGWLIGALHDGLGCMFTLMNHMRLGVGLHSLGLAERACQLALAHARERVQGRNAAGASVRIVEHADVRRMLLLMRSLTQAARGLSYTAAALLDLAQAAEAEPLSTDAERLASLLTPVVKAWCSDVAVEVASLGVQVHGGMGYVDDAEISQVYRDARIGPIFEGTNYVQAQDLLGRKVLRDHAVTLEGLLAQIEQAAASLPAAEPRLARLRKGLLQGSAELRASAHSILRTSAGEPRLVGAIAHDFLHWLGILAGGWQWAVSARAALERGSETATDTLGVAAFYASHVLPRMRVHAAVLECGVEPLLAPIADQD